jgi:ABC-type antimicrobial peptide transport system permease subunit
MAPQAFGRAVLTGLGSFAVLLMALAVYVLAESLATTRVREIGIRAALGATSGEIGAMLFGQIARLVGAGLAVGCAGAWAGATVLRALLFQVQPFDAMTVLAVTLLMFTIACVVTVAPAWRLARVNLQRLLSHT